MPAWHCPPLRGKTQMMEVALWCGGQLTLEAGNRVSLDNIVTQFILLRNCTQNSSLPMGWMLVPASLAHNYYRVNECALHIRDLEWLISMCRIFARTLSVIAGNRLTWQLPCSTSNSSQWILAIISSRYNMVYNTPGTSLNLVVLWMVYLYGTWSCKQ